ncbi:MAG: glycosyltransferase [Pirellulaceae bacterium]|nr:glycosyltransferase [Pirellulaceae bacterium]
MSISQETPIASVIITTRNRSDMLRKAVQSAVMQEGSVEVLVVDDASTDDTCEMLRQEFPTVRLEARKEQQGYIVQRNLAVKLARGPIVITIDDDAVFSSPNVVQQSVDYFENPRVGALAMAFANIFDDRRHVWFDPPAVPSATATFIGTASAVRRELFLSLGGYREYYHHWGEEMDYCLRLLNAGYFVQFAPTDLIHHFPGHSKRNFAINTLIHRNRMLAVWFNAPAILLLPMVVYSIAKSSYEGIRGRCLGTSGKGLLLAFKNLANTRKLRLPVSLKAFRIYSKLTRKMIPLTDMERIVPPPITGAM